MAFLGLQHFGIDSLNTDKLELGKLLDSAEEAANRVVADINFKRQDRAYVQVGLSNSLCLSDAVLRD